MERKKQSKFGNSGELVLESIIVYSVTLFLLFFILAIFSVLYQRWNLQTIANETAARMAQTYRFSDADASTGYVSKDQLIDVNYYRYVFSTREKKISERLTGYAQNRLSKTTYTKHVSGPEFLIDVKPDAMGRRHMELTIKGAYSVPFGEVLDFFGFGAITEYEVTAYAECVDIIDYIHYVDFVKKQTGLSQFGSSTIKAVDSVIGLVDAVISLAKKVMGL